MCGIVGYASPEPVPSGPDIVKAMNRQLNHRGPDQDGVFLSDGNKVGFGHKRLSIIDLTHGRQPMTCPEGRHTLIFNGEIYNHNELRRQLLDKGHPVKTRSDTETLLFAFKEWGAEGCASRLRGMFAFAVHDRDDGSVTLVRDRLGIKPLYYGRMGSRTLFASECKAILAHPGFPAELDPEAVSDYFSLMYVPAPKTAYKAIRKLPAGHWLRIAADGTLKQGRYWDLEFVDRGEYGSEKDMARGADDILAALEDAVKSHMESDVPMGAFLSGGVDSAAVVAMMARGSPTPILTNTVGFKDQAYDEREYARETAAAFRTDHREHTLEPDALATLRKLSWHFDEPFADSSMIPTYYVCEMARRDVTVALSGDGGDESFAGYRRYKYDALENRLRALMPAAVRGPLFGLLGAAYPKADWLPQPLRAKTLLRNLGMSPMEGYFTSMSHFLPAMKARLFSGDFKAALGGYDSLSVFESHWKNCASRDPLSRVQYLDFKTYLVDDILTKVDRTSMAVSLEVRVPLLDHRFVELAARMPSGWKLRGGEGKAVFKDALRKVLPEPIFARKKTGFAAPIKEWFRRGLAGGGASGPLEEAGLFATGLFDRKYVEGLWREHRAGLRDHTFPLFALLSFAYWHSRFLGGGAGRAA